MWRLGLDMIPAYLLVVALLTLLVAVIIWQQHRSGKTVVVWLAAGVVGILLGSVGSYAAARLAGYGLEEVLPGSPAGAQAVGTEDEGGEEGEGGPPGMGMGSGPGMGMGMGGGGRFGGPRPKRDLTTAVRKIELLTGDIGLSLSEDQATKLLKALEAIEKAEAMTDDEAQQKHDEILAILEDDQKAKLDVIGLPRSFGRGGRPGGGPGGGPPAADANPFQQETAAQALDALRQRFAPAEAPASPES